MNNPVFSILTNDCASPAGAVNGGNCVPTGASNTATLNDVMVTPGTSYLIPVTSSSGDDGTFTIRIKVIAPPANNNCDMAAELGVGSSEIGTTDCATHQDGLEFTACATNLDESDVWYTIPVDPSIKGIKVTVSGWTGGGNYGVEAYTSVSGCVLTPIMDMVDCSSTDPKEFEIATGCMDPSITAIYIKVGSPSADASVGEFTITVEELVPECTYADICDEAGPGVPLVTDPAGGIMERCQTGCLDLACPDMPPGTDCGFSVMPTVWYHFQTDNIAAQLYTTVTTSGSWTPVWSVYQGTDCTDITQVAGGSAMTPPCSNDDSTPTLHQTAVESTIMDYWIAVTADPNGPPIDDPTFEICAWTTINLLVCLGEDGNCEPDGSLIIEVVDRENGGSLDGPFCPGEKVTVRLKFFYDASESGADWLIGVVPSFGEGWNLDGFDYAGNAPSGSDWYDEDGGCAPLIQEPAPHLCTYVDADGHLHLCNKICEACAQYCGTNSGLMPGDALPSGWFWVTTGGNAGCTNDCSPGEGWGIGSTTSLIDFNVELTVKEFNDMTECLQNNNLQISFQTFSDGVAGCWEDPVGECIIDRKQFGPLWEIECEVPPAVVATPDPFEICTSGLTDITVSTEDGSSTPTIIVTFDDNPDVTGESDHTFTGGLGVINDFLTNTSDQVQIVTYHAHSEVDGLVCKGPITDFEVILYPSLLIEFPTYFVCPDFCTDISPSSITGGSGNYVSYSWTTGANTPSIFVCPIVSTTYIITVTDDKGCSGTKEVEVEVKPRVITEIDPNQVSICRNGIEGDSDPIIIDFLSGSSPYFVDWVEPFGLLGTVSTTNENNDTYNVDEENSFFTFPGSPYVVCANIQDAFGCLDTICMELTINEPPANQLDTAAFVGCGDTDATLEAMWLPTGGLGLFDHHELYDCNDASIPGGGSSTSTFGPVDLTECNTYYLFTYDQDGCVGLDTLTITTSTGEEAVVVGDEICINTTNALVEVVNASAFTTFKWNTTPPLTSPSILVNPTVTTTYTVTATDANGCSDVKSAVVTVRPQPIVSISGSTSFCAGSDTELDASAGPNAIFVWKDAGGTTLSNADTVLITAAGAYTLSVTSQFGCVKDTVINVTVDNTLTVNLNSFTLCDNSVDTLNAGAGFDGYTWTKDGVSLPDATPEIEVSMPGVYCVTVTDNAGCSGTACKTVVSNASPNVTVTDTIEVCRTVNGSGPTNLNFNNQVSGAAGTWSDTDNSTVDLSNLTNVDFSGIPRDTYTFTYTTNTAVDPCIDISRTMEVIVISCPCPTLNPIDPACNSSTALVNLNSYIANNPSGIIGTWAWVSGPQNITPSNGMVSVSGVSAGDYSFAWTPNSGTCSAITGTLTVFAAPTVSFLPGPHQLCNATGGQFSTTLDLNTLLSSTTPIGGTWTQVSGTPVASLPIIDVDMKTPESLVFKYTTSSAVAPCTNANANVTIIVRDCNCPLVDIKPITICNSSSPINLNDSLTTDPAGLAGTWSSTTPGVISGSNFNPSGLTSGQYDITFTLTVDPGANCQRTFPGIVIVRNQPKAEKGVDGAPCNEDTGNGVTTVNLFSLLKPGYSPGGTWTQVSGTPALTIPANGIVDFNGQTIGANYSFTYTTTNAVAPCTNVSATVNVTVQNCLCPNVKTYPPAALCNSELTFNLASIEDAAIEPGTWTVKRGSTNIPVVNDTILNVNGLIAGDYVLTYTLTTVPSGGCPKFSTQTLRIEEQNFAILDPTAIEVCNVDKGNGENVLNFNDLVTGGDKFGKWTNTDNAPIDFTNPGLVVFTNAVSIGQQFKFTYTVKSTSPCVDVSYVVLVTISDCTCPPLTPLKPADACASEGTVNLSQYDDPNRPGGTWSSTQATITNNKLDVSTLNTGNYTLTYTPLDLDANCTPKNVTITVVKPGIPGMAEEPMHLCFGVGQNVQLAI